jgi:excinuclease UvrABC helicase subunit UvrB
MAAKKKHTKSYDTVTRRISNLQWEIQERMEELTELAELLQQYEFSASVDLRSLAEMGVTPAPLV